MDGDVSGLAALALLLLAGVVLDVILRPLPMLAAAATRRRRHLYWGGLVLLYLALMTLL
jgi:hypothetical protein